MLFLGDHGHHVPLLRARQLFTPAALDGIDITYTETDRSEPCTLNQYDCLPSTPTSRRSPRTRRRRCWITWRAATGSCRIHCASFCFLNSPKYIALVGGQFKSHNTGVFARGSSPPDHPIMKGFAGFESWDETYVHSKHNEEGRTVLEMRDKEPYTWVRDAGQGPRLLHRLGP